MTADMASTLAYLGSQSDVGIEISFSILFHITLEANKTFQERIKYTNIHGVKLGRIFIRSGSN